ncbi:MAG: hypothetical protein KF715_12955 [Candidatus Didemnitutus sp.]|nr:hypothetical protein [Candidatus Didemnitutus sp.]
MKLSDLNHWRMMAGNLAIAVISVLLRDILAKFGILTGWSDFAACYWLTTGICAVFYWIVLAKNIRWFRK